MEYITKSNVTFILAVFGSIGTITSWIYAYFATRKNIILRVIAYQAKNNILLTYLSFENKSRLAISITNLALKVNGTYFPCRHLPQRVTSSQQSIGGKIVSSIDYYNIRLPIELGGLGSNSGYVLFVLPKGVGIPDSKILTLQVVSNRGKAVETTLPLDQTLEAL